MAENQGGSPLFNNIMGQLKKAQADYSGKPPEIGNAGLPPGLEGATAQLTKCEFGKYAQGANIGKPYFMAMGTVLTPENFKGRKVAGLQTKIGPIPLCDTPTATGKNKTFADHYGTFRNELLKLDLNIDKVPADANWENVMRQLMKRLVDAGTQFFFRTWKGRDTKTVEQGGKWYVYNVDDNTGKTTGAPIHAGSYPSQQVAKVKHPGADRESQVVHEWNGKVEPVAPEVSGAVVDHEASPTEPQAPYTLTPENEFNQPAPQPRQSAPPSSPPAPPVQEAPADTPSEDETLEELIAKAKAGNQEAIDKLVLLSTSLGIEEATIIDAPNWDAVEAMIMEASAALGSTEEEALPEPQFKVGQVYSYAPWNGRLKKKGTPVECSVEQVFSDNGSTTVNLKNLTDGKTIYKGVKAEELTPAS